ncbi:MAG: hypothetical protein ABJ360_13405, partial [Roseobacter sp.]
HQRHQAIKPGSSRCMKIAWTPDLTITQHLHAVIGLMRASATWEGFKSLLDRAFPKKGTQMTLLLEDPE